MAVKTEGAIVDTNVTVVLDSDDEEACNPALSRVSSKKAAGKRRRLLVSDDEDEEDGASDTTHSRGHSKQAAGKRRRSSIPVSPASPTRQVKRPRNASEASSTPSTQSRSRSGSGASASALELPDPTAVADRTIRSSKMLADDLSHLFVQCATAFDHDNIDQVKMTELADCMLKLWREIELSQKEADVLTKLSSAAKMQWSHIRKQIKANPPLVSPPILEKLKQVKKSLQSGVEKLQLRGRKSGAGPRAQITDRAAPAPRVPQELAPSTLHKDPKRVVAEAAKLGLDNAPRTHAEWLEFAKNRPTDAKRLNEALRATRKREMQQQSENRAAK